MLLQLRRKRQIGSPGIYIYSNSPIYIYIYIDIYIYTSRGPILQYIALMSILALQGLSGH